MSMSHESKLHKVHPMCPNVWPVVSFKSKYGSVKQKLEMQVMQKWCTSCLCMTIEKNPAISSGCGAVESCNLRQTEHLAAGMEPSARRHRPLWRQTIPDALVDISSTYSSASRCFLCQCVCVWQPTCAHIYEHITFQCHAKLPLLHW